MLPKFSDNPFHLQLSFHKIIERLEEVALNDNGQQGQNARCLLQKVADHPEFIDGITDIAQIENNTELIAELLADLFPRALTLNEIKAITIPYQRLIFNHTQRFLKIINDAGPGFEINIRGLDDHQLYLMSCCLILNAFYGTNLDFSKPLFYDIPAANGIVKHYRILYNADFMEIIPTEKASKLTQSDIDQLIDNYDNLALWKEKFPAGSWRLKGFIIMTLFDATVENAVSILKSSLLGNANDPDLQKNLESIFRSIFKIPDIRMGFTLFDQTEGKLINPAMGPQIHSFLLSGQPEECDSALCTTSYQSIITQQAYLAISDIDTFLAKHPDSDMGRHFKEQGIKSFILAPVVKNGVLLGILELVSPRVRELNTVNAHTLEIVMPFLVDTIDRKINDLQNRVRAIIQSNYTTLHPSVYWKFRREAQNFIQSVNKGLAYTLKEIKFKDVYPLYGQVDISESSATRNISVRNDLISQLKQLIVILKKLKANTPSAAIEGKLFDLKTFVKELSVNIRADTEQYIQHYVEEEVYPLLKSENGFSAGITKSIDNYFKQIDALTGEFYINRRNYDKTLSLINEKLAGILDRRQTEIQEYFPHYYERFKTDGIEHNIYIGASIAPGNHFELSDMHRLRLWQLRVIAEMEIEQHDLKSVLPYPLEVTSLILVFSAPIAIRFRMDEKHFDVDGAYNIRYEVIKKRIDKAHIKNSQERITQQGKITIIYSQAEEEEEYYKYISILQKAGILDNKVEHFEVEELQGVSGLKALRVGVIYHQNILSHRMLSYKGLYKQLD